MVARFEPTTTCCVAPVSHHSTTIYDATFCENCLNNFARQTYLEINHVLKLYHYMYTLVRKFNIHDHSFLNGPTLALF